MSNHSYRIKAGESIFISLLVLEGDIGTITGVQAVLKKAGTNRSVPRITEPVIAEFIITVTEQPDIGWDLYIPGSVTQNLKPGFYITNAKLTHTSGEAIKTEPILIEIRGTVT